MQIQKDPFENPQQPQIINQDRKDLRKNIGKCVEMSYKEFSSFRVIGCNSSAVLVQ